MPKSSAGKIRSGSYAKHRSPREKKVRDLAVRHHGSNVTMTTMVAHRSRTRLTSARERRTFIPPRQPPRPKSKKHQSGIRVAITRLGASQEKKTKPKREQKTHGLACWMKISDGEQLSTAIQNHIDQDKQSCLAECWTRIPCDMQLEALQIVARSSCRVGPLLANIIGSNVMGLLKRGDVELSRALVAKLSENVTQLLQQDAVSSTFLEVVAQCSSSQDMCFDVIQPLIMELKKHCKIVCMRVAGGYELLVHCARLTGDTEALVWRCILADSEELFMFPAGCCAIKCALDASVKEGRRGVRIVVSTLGDPSKMKSALISDFQPEVFCGLLQSGEKRAMPLVLSVLEAMESVIREASGRISDEGKALADLAVQYYLNEGRDVEWTDRAVSIQNWLKEGR